MSEAESYQASTYIPPHAAIVVGNILRAPRKVRHIGNITYVFSPNREEQLEYVDGLMVVSSVFLIFWILWAFVLIVLKFKGKEVGCASGRAFITVRPDDDDEDDGEHEYDDYYNEKPTQDEIGSTSSSSGVISDNNQYSSPNDDENSNVGNISNDDGGKLLVTVTSDVLDDDDDVDVGRNRKANLGRFSSPFAGKNSKSNHKVTNRNKKVPRKNVPSSTITATKVNQRELRTRFCFIFFASLALICVPLILVLSFSPMQDATASSDQLILVVRDTMNQVEAGLNSIQSASMSALEIVNSTPTDLGTVCPLVSDEELQATLGIDLKDIVGSVTAEYERLKAEVDAQLSAGNSIVDRIDHGLSGFEVSITATEEYLWIVPALLFAVSVLAAISILGVILAWKEKSGLRFQRAMSYVVLPLLILVSIACWMVVVAASVSSMVGTDLCISSSSTGSPDQTIQEILSLQGLGANDTAYQMTSAYTNRCEGPDPLQQLNHVEDEIQNNIDNIWRQMSQIDSLGRATVMEKCGNADAFTDMLTGARNLAKLLTGIRRSLSSIRNSLECSVINPIYAQAAHVTLCTYGLTASVNGFIMFLVVAICVMAMISLRASWLRHIEEEKVYHDEDEVAENMILDEHEEYLAYISRYKHEWQEYGGFEEDGAVQSDDGYVDDETDEGSGYFEDDGQRNESCDDGSEYCSDISDADLSSLGAGKVPATYLLNGVDDGVSHVSDDISFPSFSGQKSVEDQHRVREEDLFSVPPPLLPPPMNPELIYDEPGESFSALPRRAADAPLTDQLGLPAPSKYSNPRSVRRKNKESEQWKWKPETKRSAAVIMDPRHNSSLSAKLALEKVEQELNLQTNYDDDILQASRSTGEVEVQISNRPRSLFRDPPASGDLVHL